MRREVLIWLALIPCLANTSSATAGYLVTAHTVSSFELRTNVWQREHSEGGGISGAEQHGIPDNSSSLEWKSKDQKVRVTISDDGRFSETHYNFADACFPTGQLVQFNDEFATTAVWKKIQRNAKRAFKKCASANSPKIAPALTELRSSNTFWVMAATEYMAQSRKLFGSLKGRCLELISPEPPRSHTTYVERCKAYDAQ